MDLNSLDDLLGALDDDKALLAKLQGQEASEPADGARASADAASLDEHESETTPEASDAHEEDGAHAEGEHAPAHDAQEASGGHDGERASGEEPQAGDAPEIDLGDDIAALLDAALLGNDAPAARAMDHDPAPTDAAGLAADGHGEAHASHEPLAHLEPAEAAAVDPLNAGFDSPELREAGFHDAAGDGATGAAPAEDLAADPEHARAEGDGSDESAHGHGEAEDFLSEMLSPDSDGDAHERGHDAHAEAHADDASPVEADPAILGALSAREAPAASDGEILLADEDGQPEALGEHDEDGDEADDWEFVSEADAAEAARAADANGEGAIRADELGAALAAAAGLSAAGAAAAGLFAEGRRDSGAQSHGERDADKPASAAPRAVAPADVEPQKRLTPRAGAQQPGADVAEPTAGQRLAAAWRERQAAQAKPADPQPAPAKPAAPESRQETSAAPADAEPAKAASGVMGFFKAPEQRPFAPEQRRPRPAALRARSEPNPYLVAIAPMLRAGGGLDPRHARAAAEALGADALAFRLARTDAPLLSWGADGLDTTPNPQTLEKAFFAPPSRGSLCSSLDLAPAQEALVELYAAIWRMSRAPTARAFAAAAHSASENARPARERLQRQWAELSEARAQGETLDGARFERVGLGLEMADLVLRALAPERVAEALMASRMEARPKPLQQSAPTGFFESFWARASAPLRRALEDAAAHKAEKRAADAYGSDTPGSAIWRQACKRHLLDGLRQAVEALNRFNLASFEIHGLSVEGPFDLAERAQRFAGSASRACQKLGARSRAFGLGRRLGVSLDDPRLAEHPQAPLALFDLAGCRALASSRFAGLDASLMHEWTHALDARSGAALMGPKAWLDAGCPFASALSARLGQRGKKLESLTLPDRLHGVPPPKAKAPAIDPGLIEEPLSEDSEAEALAEAERLRDSGARSPRPIGSNEARAQARQEARQNGNGSNGQAGFAGLADGERLRAEPLTAESILSSPSDPFDLDIRLAQAAQETPAQSLARAWGELVSGAIGAHEGLGAWSGHARLTPEDAALSKKLAEAQAKSLPIDTEELALLEARAAAQTLRPILSRALSACEEPLSRDPKTLRSMLLAFGPEAKPWLDALAAALASGGAANFKTRLSRIKKRMRAEIEAAELEQQGEKDKDGKGGKDGKGAGSSLFAPESLWARSLSEFGRLREAVMKAKGAPGEQEKILDEAGVSRDQFSRAREAEKALEAKLADLTKEAAGKMLRKSRILGRPANNPERWPLALLESAEKSLDAIAQWALTHTADGHFSPRPNAFFAESARIQFQDPASAFAARWRSSDELAARAIENLAPKASWLDFARPQAAAFNIPLGPDGRERLRHSLREICQALRLPVSRTAPGPETLGERALAMQEALLAKFDALRSAKALEEGRNALLRRPSRH
jgi:hypothetical protein